MNNYYPLVILSFASLHHPLWGPESWMLQYVYLLRTTHCKPNEERQQGHSLPPYWHDVVIHLNGRSFMSSAQRARRRASTIWWPWSSVVLLCSFFALHSENTAPVFPVILAAFWMSGGWPPLLYFCNGGLNSESKCGFAEQCIKPSSGGCRGEEEPPARSAIKNRL